MIESEFQILIPQELAHKYMAAYEIPEIVMKYERYNDNFIVSMPVIVDVEPIFERLEFKDTTTS